MILTETNKTIPLRDGSRVVVVGAGPAGSFFAVHLLAEARKVGRSIEVLVIDKKIPENPAPANTRLKACNFCAGVISPRLHEALSDIGIEIPAELICEEFTHIWIHGLWKSFPLKIPRGQRMYSVFRGALPHGRTCSPMFGLDDFLLKEALARGAVPVSGEVYDIRYSISGKPVVSARTLSGEKASLEADFVALCTGINFRPGGSFEDNPVLKSFRKANPRFGPPETRPCLVVELKPGRDYLRKYMDKEIYIVVSGSKTARFDHVALVPKKEYLTVALAGESVRGARTPDEATRIVQSFLSIPYVRNILPGLESENVPFACQCSPRMAARPARAPYADRIGMAGDVLGARLYRDGLYSAFAGAKALARTAVLKGVDSRSLAEGCGGFLRWLERDNRYGSLVFGLFQTALKHPAWSRILYQTFATEMKFEKMDRWPLGGVLRKIGTGSCDYRDVFGDLVRFRVFLSILRGFYKTARNYLTEIFFGISWEGVERYPTVILKEKRDHFKKSISASLGVALDDHPEMERMYAVKIRASSQRIYEELGKFGNADSRFLKLRFVDVKRVSGSPNQAGAVVRYDPKPLPFPMDIRLTKCVPGRFLLYEPDELFATNGKLVFDISPTKDGNNRLTIYTAFDFKKGRGFFEKVFRGIFRKLFPEYAHDVVWNHAVCRIKGDAEKAARDD